MKLPALVAEFIGTFALIFVGVLVCKHLGQAEAGLIGIALGHGLTIACMVTSTAAISGGHLNPAVSFGLFIAKKLDGLTMILYWIAQFLGAVAAAIAVQFVLVGDAIKYVEAGTPKLADKTSSFQGLIAEAIATFFLVLMVFGTAVDKRAPKMGGLFIGLTVTTGIFAIGPITGGALNPARWFGPALVSGGLGSMLVYLVGPLVGGALAGLIYSRVFEEKVV